MYNLFSNPFVFAVKLLYGNVRLYLTKNCSNLTFCQLKQISDCVHFRYDFLLQIPMVETKFLNTGKSSYLQQYDSFRCNLPRDAKPSSRCRRRRQFCGRLYPLTGNKMPGY